jgi:hypothetical protein
MSGASGSATSRTVPGSIPGGVTGFFSDISPSDRSMALGSTQPLAKISTRNITRGKGGRCMRLTTSPPSRAECHEIWEPKPPGTLWATPGLLRDSFTFTCKCQLLHVYYCLTVNVYSCIYIKLQFLFCEELEDNCWRSVCAKLRHFNCSLININFCS